MNKKVSIGVTISLVVVAIALTISVTMVVAMRQFSSMVNDVGKRQVMFDYITDIDKLVRQHFSNIDEEKLRTSLAKGYIDGIDDPYAAYLTAEEYKVELEAREGKITGFGIEVTRAKSGEIIISGLEKNSPAAAAGLQKWDVVTAVDGTPIDEVGLSTLREKLAGSKKVIITYDRDGTPQALEISASLFAMVSAEGYMINDTTGYIRINAFNDTTLDQFKGVYTSLEQSGAAHFIFDVRGTAGGTLEAASGILEYLLPRGAYAQNVDGKNGDITTLSAEDNYEMSQNAVTLINENTSGVAELFAGVLQEFGKSSLVGTKTMGHGKIQQCYTVASSGAAIKLSVSSVALLKGGAIEGVGVTPNHVVELTTEQIMYFDLLSEAEDPQLQTAVELAVNGHVSTEPTEPDVPDTSDTEPVETETTASEETQATEPEAE